MPTYNVRMDSGDGPDDGEAMDFPDVDKACRDALVAMTEIARERIPGETKAHLGIEIDDEDGQPVYRAEMNFQGSQGDPKSAPLTAEELPVGPRD